MFRLAEFAHVPRCLAAEGGLQLCIDLETLPDFIVVIAVQNGAVRTPEFEPNHDAFQGAIEEDAVKRLMRCIIDLNGPIGLLRDENAFDVDRGD